MFLDAHKARPRKEKRILRTKSCPSMSLTVVFFATSIAVMKKTSPLHRLQYFLQKEILILSTCQASCRTIADELAQIHLPATGHIVWNITSENTQQHRKNIIEDESSGHYANNLRERKLVLFHNQSAEVLVSVKRALSLVRGDSLQSLLKRLTYTSTKFKKNKPRVCVASHVASHDVFLNF